MGQQSILTPQCPLKHQNQPHPGYRDNLPLGVGVGPLDMHHCTLLPAPPVPSFCSPSPNTAHLGTGILLVQQAQLKQPGHILIAP